MLSVFQYSMNAVFPILLLIFLGYLGHASGMLSEKTVAQVNRFNFRFGYFCLMFTNIYSVDLSEGLPLRLILLTMGIIVFLTCLGWAASAFLTRERGRRGILIQAAFRSNYAIIGMMMAQALAGDDAAAMVAIFQLPAVLYYNTVSVLMMSVYSDSKKKVSIGSVLHTMAVNPLIQGILAAIAALLIRPHIPLGADGEPVFTIAGSLPWLMTTMTNLSRMCTPLSLICLGGNLKISDAGHFMKELIGGVVMRLIAAPVIGLSLVFSAERMGLVKITPAAVAMLISVLGSPLATACAIMAAEMDADADLAGQLVVWTSVLSMVSLFVIVFVLRLLGRL